MLSADWISNSNLSLASAANCISKNMSAWVSASTSLKICGLMLNIFTVTLLLV